MSKNVILTDKNGEQIAPATISDIVAYDDNKSVKDKIDELNERIDELVTGNVEPLTVTANGTYTAPEGIDGYNPVTVDVNPYINWKLIRGYDFTVSSNDIVYPFVVVDDNNGYNIQRTDGVGYTFLNHNAYLNLRAGLYQGCDCKVRIKFGAMDMTNDSGLGQIFKGVSNLYYDGSQWKISGSSGTTNTGITDQ